MNTIERQRLLGGVVAMVVGCSLLSAFLLAMNRRVHRPAEALAELEAELALPPPPKKIPKRERIERLVRKVERTPRAARPSLATDLSSLGGGVALFDAPGFQDLPSQMLGDSDDTGEIVMTEETVDTQPLPLPGNRPPAPPPEAQRKRISGRVVLRLMIDDRGNVRDAHVIESEPSGFFDDAVLDAARTWRFQPATYRGKPVTLRVDQTIRFDLG